MLHAALNRRSSCVAMSFALLLGCGAQDDENGRPATDPGGTESQTQTTDDIIIDDDEGTDPITPPVEGCQGIDLLFVVDNSGSMGEEQENLISNFPKFIEVLDNFEPEPGANISYRVGLTTASVTRKFTSTTLIPGFPPASTKVNEKGQDGAFVNTSECGLSQPWIEGPDASASSEFSCMGNVGAMGSSYEMPLAAMELALGKQTAQGGANEGFYRKGEDSLLVVVIITDEDDCSVEEGGTLIADSVTGSDCNPAKCKGLYSIDDSKMFLDELTGGEGRYVVTGIAGRGPKACSSTFGNAIYAQRMNQFVQLVGAYGVFGNICSGDLWSSLKEALSVIKVACKSLRPV